MADIDIAEWERSFEEACDVMGALSEAGTWLRGPTTLMRVLKAHRSEVHHSRALGWLLDPLGTHQLGRRFLDGFLELVDADPAEFPAAHTDVRLEVYTFDRATQADGSIDIMLRGQQRSIVIENKWHAAETGDQLDRYWRGTGKAATYVYLTLEGERPRNAVESGEWWLPVSWRTQIWPLLDGLVANHPRGEDAPAAVVDYAQTLREAF